MRLDSLKGIFRATFERQTVEQTANDTGAFTRIRDIAPFDLLLSLLTACCIGPRRSIAGARSAYERLSGAPISPSAFDERLDTPGCVRWTWQMLTEQMARVPMVELGTHFATERAAVVTPHLPARALEIYPDNRMYSS
jgi:hypothetical protein